ncbi:MAG: hypothetical protein R8L07_14290 [Alphaproteobacteria bacterium]|nr:hypothetical protein [Alphaproteobacteria bacterium]
MFDYSLPDATRKILDGCRIVPVMSPDDSLGDRYFNPLPAYRESYPLTHLVTRDDLFWGATSGTNQPYVIRTGLPDPVVLAYTNSAPVYASYAIRPMTHALEEGGRRVRIAPLHHYSDFRFLVREDGQAIWDGTEPDRTEPLRAAIEDGRSYRVVMEIEDGTILSLPVDIPMYFPGDNSLNITTHPGFLPTFFGDPQSLIDGLAAHNANMLTLKSAAAESANVTVPVFPVFFSIRSDGSYFGVNEIMSGDPKRWSRVRLFAY